MRALLFLLLIVALFLLVRFVINRVDQFRREAEWEEAARERAEKAAKIKAQQPEPMIHCEVCNLHLPEKEGLCVTDNAGEKHCFCSKTHLEQFIEEKTK